jgi:tight adherence protein B
MTRRALVVSAIAALGLVLVPAATADLQLTPVKRLSFPQRAFLVDLGRDADLGRAHVGLFENGTAIRRFKLQPLAASPLDSAVVLAIDASDSMAGRPYTAAVSAVRAFATGRTNAERIGVVAFNNEVHVVREPTADVGRLERALDHPPALAYGTRAYDAVTRSLELLSAAQARTGAIIVLSDGADVGSVEGLEGAVAAAQAQRVRVFTVGLRSKSYDPEPLRALAEETGGSYSEAKSAVELADIYTTLGRRLSSQYVLRYRSDALPSSDVTVRLAIDGVGAGAVDYTAPKPSGVAPYHRPLLKRFVLSGGAAVLLSLLIAVLIGALLASAIARGRSGLVGRVEEFFHGVRTPTEQLKEKGRQARTALAGSPHAQGRLAKLERDLEIARIDIPAARVAVLTAAGTVVLVFILALVSPILCLLGVLGPLSVRGWMNRKLKIVRNDFADQLPPNLQVLASALRAGHSFSGALAVMVENADAPSDTELRRAVNDDRLGIPADEALRRVADRMASRDLHQVALLSELQRTSGGNAAEVLDTVVETIRERAEVRRLLRTLTAQGRMARWILTALPVAVAALLTLIQPDVMRPLFTTTAGFVALTIAGLMVIAGSFVIQRIVDIEV